MGNKSMAEMRAISEQYKSMPYEAKVSLARARIWEWYETCRANEKNCHVSVGGLDSITLLHLVRDELGDRVPAISISALEDKSIQTVHKELGVIPLAPIKSKVQVLNELGFPVISKGKAKQTPRRVRNTAGEGCWII